MHNTKPKKYTDDQIMREKSQMLSRPDIMQKVECWVMAERVGQWDSGLMNIYCRVSLTSCVVLTQEHYIVGCAYESLRAFFTLLFIWY